MSSHEMEQQQQQQQRTAGALGGKTARACDGCLRRRARWYCAADDAFLCQACDSSVHSANPLARRHQRVRIKTSASSVVKLDDGPAWHQAITRKARTPRPKPGVITSVKSEPVVPDLEAVSADENNVGEEDQLVYHRVPEFDPLLAEFCSPVAPAGGLDDDMHGFGSKREEGELPESGSLTGFLPADDDVDLAEFAADMETLLGRGLEEDAFCMESLGIGFSGEEDKTTMMMKVEMKEEVNEEERMDFDGREMVLELNFDCGSPTPEVEVEEKVVDDKTMKLRLNYEAVIAAWSSSCQGSSPWTDGDRPKLNPDECLPEYKGGMWPVSGQVTAPISGGGGDGGREARVTRYREKRRTRLFAKKIRYEVRKLNAEKRPRMKGRFVKRSSFAVGAGVGPSFGF
ncbi:putative transcription factor C2C2-CO-like family [Dioscorea sansibarensis]